MTAKKDLKRRVRERQERTGESYVTARRQVTARRGTPIPVVELSDLTAEATALGLRCRVLASDELLERVDGRDVLVRLRDAVTATADDPLLAGFRAVLLEARAPAHATIATIVEGKRFMARARAGIGGAADSGRLLALPVAGRRGVEMVVVLLYGLPRLLGSPPRPPTVLLGTADGFLDGVRVWVR